METTIKLTEKEQWTAPEIKVIGVNENTLGNIANPSGDDGLGYGS